MNKKEIEQFGKSIVEINRDWIAFSQALSKAAAECYASMADLAELFQKPQEPLHDIAELVKEASEDGPN